MTEGWHTAAELARLKLPGLPRTERAIQLRAAREDWKSRERQARGGGREHPVSALPKDAQHAIARRRLADRPAHLPAVRAPQAATDLKDWQRRRLEARAALLAEIDRLMLDGLTQGKAVKALVDAAHDRILAPELQRLIPVANARAGGSGARTLSRRAVYYWLESRAAAGGDVTALAPAPAPEAAIPAWAGALMDLHGRPTKPSLQFCIDELARPGALPAGVKPPTYDQARGFFKKLDTISKNTGRLGPRALKALKAYHARDTSELWPGAVFVGDGHTFKAEVAHPIHGRPFRPEVTTAIDAFTRRICGWSAALAESAVAVADCFRHAATTSTTPDIWYYDNGSGANNAHHDDPITGLLARVGTAKKNSIAWSSQARGIIEIIHKTVYHPAAKRLATYVGADMDREARQKAFKVTRADVKATGTSRILPSWADFLALVQRAIGEYNARPHSSLPKIVDPATGRRRHQFPNEAWAAAIATGWQPDPIPAAEAEDLFRPAVRRTTNRALVSLFGNDYYHRSLEALGGTEVMVAYDIHDASTVWVRDLQGRMICEAVWDGHKTSYFPVTVAEQARQNRVAQKLKRLDAHRDTAEAELRAPLLEHQPAMVVPPIPAPEPVAVPAGKVPVDPSARPRFADDVEWATWLVRNPSRVTPEDAAQLRIQLRNASFCTLVDWGGIDLPTLHALSTRTEAA
jgi:putative transposase